MNDQDLDFLLECISCLFLLMAITMTDAKSCADAIERSNIITEYRKSRGLS